MSEHENTSRPVDDLNLTEADLARALATSLDRGHRLVRRRNQRRAALGGLGVAALLASGFGVINSLSDDGTDVSVTPAVEGTSVERTTTTVPATTVPVDTTTVETTFAPDTSVPGSVLAPAASTTTTPPVPTSAPRIPDDPAGFTRTELPNGVIQLENSAWSSGIGDVTTTSAPSGAAIGPGGYSEGRWTDIRSSVVVSRYVLRVELDCLQPVRLQSIRYRLVGNVVTVSVNTAGLQMPDCSNGVYPIYDLVFRGGDLPANATAVAGFLDAE